jgi:hypothetical protein
LLADDLNSDRRDEVVVTYAPEPGGNLTGAFYQNITDASGNIDISDGPTLQMDNGAAGDPISADFDLDEKVDVIKYSTGSSLRLLRNIGSVGGSLQFTEQSVPVSGELGRALKADVDIDGRSDLITFSNSESITVFLNTGATGQISFAPGQIISNESLWPMAVADLNGDQKPEIIATSHFVTAFLAVFKNYSTPGTVSFSEKQVHAYGGSFLQGGLGDITVGEFNGDSRLDIATGFANTRQGLLSILLSEQCTEKSTAPFDYDGDGKSDYSVWRPSDGTWYLALSDSGSMYVQPWGQATDKITPADYDGDGVTDMAVYRPSEGKWYVIYSQSVTINAISFGLNGDVPLPQDFDGDGKADFGIWRPSDGTWYLGLSQSGSMYVLPFGLATDKPVPADFDGDGKSEIAVWRPSEGRWYVGNIATGGFGTYDWGLNGDMPVVGDFSGDGKADYAVYRPSNQTWYRVHTDTFSVVEKQFGVSGDIPAPGDFDGDGKLDIAVYRPTEGRWYVWTATSTPLSQLFGLNGDVPTESAFVY